MHASQPEPDDPEPDDPQGRLGMTDAQWAQWQAYTHGFGEQDENGIDLSLLRANLRLTPTERLHKHLRALRTYREVYHAGVAARLRERPARA